MAIEPQEFTAQRNEAMREGVKGLFLMNGGGATAMLAFLRAIWTTEPQLARWVVGCIAFFAVGLVLAGLVQFFRHHASFAVEEDRRGAFEVYRFLYRAAAYASLVAFLVGVLVLVVGALCILPK